MANALSPFCYSPLDEAEKTRIYNRVMEEKVSPQLVSQETGYGVAQIRNIIKERGGKLPSRYTHTASKVSNKTGGEVQQEQQQQPVASNQPQQPNQQTPPITGPNQRFQRPPYLNQQHQMGGPRPNMSAGYREVCSSVTELH